MRRGPELVRAGRGRPDIFAPARWPEIRIDGGVVHALENDRCTTTERKRVRGERCRYDGGEK